RLDDPEKHWKFSTGDLAERARWDAYQEAFHDAIARCSTDHAPWYVIPANKKWFRNVLVARIVADTLEDMNPRFPDPEPGLERVAIPD
ncbi:MAG TPA: polyphosphate kinase 2 family protein, partial [Thermomicrobiales bacterium]|nr:polyphosphate kinase 2 family protein [Thermomicrobiales bacterium]